MSGLQHGCTAGPRYTRRGSPTHRIWRSILDRCNNERSRDFCHYGGRGIKVCDRWLSFVNFLADMGERPDGLWIDRINNDGDYEPSNCQWTTPTEQARNRRGTRLNADLANEIHGRYEHGEGMKSISRRIGVSEKCVYSVVRGLTWKELAAS